MTRLTSPFIYPTVLAVAVALLATLTLASPRPTHAATGDSGRRTAGKASAADRVEARIKELHAQLHITPAQENLWQNVTQVMRDNAQRMDALAKARAEHAQTMTAVDDVRTYSDIAEAHAEGIKKFLPAFEALYASMSDAQKQQTDAFFHQRLDRRLERHAPRG
jgi:LTXXQ motif family protein